MADTLDPKMLDKRIAQRFVKKGLLDQKDWERHLKALPDVSDNAATIESTLEPMHVEAGGSHPEEE